MSDTELKVTYRNGEPHEITFGRGMMGGHTSLAYVRGESTAAVSFDNSGTTDFERELLKLPFIDDVVTPGDGDD